MTLTWKQVQTLQSAGLLCLVSCLLVGKHNKHGLIAVCRVFTFQDRDKMRLWSQPRNNFQSQPRASLTIVNFLTGICRLCNTTRSMETMLSLCLLTRCILCRELPGRERGRAGQQLPPRPTTILTPTSSTSATSGLGSLCCIVFL